MASAPINPTQITPPRVAFIDERTGAISREWFRFLLSLQDSAQTSQEAATLTPSTESLVASYAAMLDALTQETESQPSSASADDVAVLQTQIVDLEVEPPCATLDDAALLQTQIADLELEPPCASIADVALFQTQAQDLAESVLPDPQTFLLPVWSALQDLALAPSVITPTSSMVYPASGIANSTGSAWGTSYSTTGSGTLVVLSSSPTITGKITFGGTALSASAWSTSGIGLIQAATTYTDNSTAASGTVVSAYMNLFAAQTYAAANTGVTVSNLYGTYFAAPIAGTNVTATSRFALGVDSLYVLSSVSIPLLGSGNLFDVGSSQSTSIIRLGGLSQSGTITLGRSTVTNTTDIQAGATASGSTKTINIGTAGLSGSTTTITIGSAVSGATSNTVLNGTHQSQGYTVATLPAAGTAGRRAHVTDALAPVFLGTLTGGGAVRTPVFDNGTAWVAG